MLTFISLEDIQALEQEMSSSQYTPNTAQKILAREVTQFVHGAEGLKQAEAATQVIHCVQMIGSALLARPSIPHVSVQ